MGYGLGASGAGIDGFVELQRGAAVHGMCGDMLTQEPGHTIYYNIHMYKCICIYEFVIDVMHIDIYYCVSIYIWISVSCICHECGSLKLCPLVDSITWR